MTCVEIILLTNQYNLDVENSQLNDETDKQIINYDDDHSKMTNYEDEIQDSLSTLSQN